MSQLRPETERHTSSLENFLGYFVKAKVKQTSKQLVDTNRVWKLRFLFTSVSVLGAFNGPALSKVSESIEIHKILICTLLVLYYFFLQINIAPLFGP